MQIRNQNGGKSWRLTTGMPLFIYLLIFCCLPILLLGCQSSNFRAKHLPNEYRIQKSSKGNQINLARLSSYNLGNSLLAPGDLLEVTVATGLKDEKYSPMLLRVAKDGTVSVPIIGEVPISDLEPFDAAETIKAQAIDAGIYVNPTVTVEIKKKAVNRITVLGAVKNPGVHEIPRGSSDVVVALANAGGLTDKAGTEIEILRQNQTFMADNSNAETSNQIQLTAYNSLPISGNRENLLTSPRLTRIDLADVRSPSHINSNLKDQDVLIVPQRKKEVFHVAGLVNKPGQFEMPTDQDVHLLDAIAMAGGQSSIVANKIFVIRRLKGRAEPIVIQASLRNAKTNGRENIRLAAGDTVTIEQTPATVVVDSLSKLMRISFGVAGRTTTF